MNELKNQIGLHRESFTLNFNKPYNQARQNLYNMKQDRSWYQQIEAEELDRWIKRLKETDISFIEKPIIWDGYDRKGMIGMYKRKMLLLL